jgi:hypothetical protein
MLAIIDISIIHAIVYKQNRSSVSMPWNEGKEMKRITKSRSTIYGPPDPLYRVSRVSAVSLTM